MLHFELLYGQLKFCMMFKIIIFKLIQISFYCKIHNLKNFLGILNLGLILINHSLSVKAWLCGTAKIFHILQGQARGKSKKNCWRWNFSLIFRYNLKNKKTSQYQNKWLHRNLHMYSKTKNRRTMSLIFLF